jgi:GTPase
MKRLKLVIGCRAAGPLELRVAVLGNMDSGKSTLIGVLTKGALDNGYGGRRFEEA